MVRGYVRNRSQLVAPCSNVTVVLTDCTDAFANQLRWCVGRDIPTLALNEVNILQSSPFPDEYIAHRVALMPFAPTKPGAQVAKVHLDVQGEGRVLAHQIQGEAKAMTPNLVVTTLPEGCFIRMTGKFDVGCGKDHQRYNHVACARVARRSDGAPHHLEECWCMDTKPGKVCVDCAGTKSMNPDAKVVHVLYFETFGVNSPDEVLRQAILITRAKLGRIAVQLRAAGKNRNTHELQTAVGQQRDREGGTGGPPINPTHPRAEGPDAERPRTPRM